MPGRQRDFFLHDQKCHYLFIQTFKKIENKARHGGRYLEYQLFGRLRQEDRWSS